MRRLLSGLVVGGLIAVTPARAQVLDFEDIIPAGQSFGEILEFYSGGASVFGTTGPDFGISFFGNALAVCATGTALGCTGNLDQLPSGNSALFFLTSDATGMNSESGFLTGFSFFYAAGQAGNVSVYSGLDGSGTLLASADFPATTLFGDPSCQLAYCPFSPFGISFGGTGKSIVFTGVANFVAFDDVTFGSINPGGGNGGGEVVPEPASIALLATGLVAVLLYGYRRRHQG